MSDAPPRIVLIAGPTAVGKSSIALELAERLGGELLSVDSVQLYRGLDIGSAKPSAQERARVRHHLIDTLEPEDENNVADFAASALEIISDAAARGTPIVAVGGTNLYVRVLVHGIFDAPPPDAEIRARHHGLADEHGVAWLHDELRRVDAVLADRVHVNDLVRISRGLEVFELTGVPLSEHQRQHAFAQRPVEALKVALNRPRPELYERIERRVDAMMEDGLLQEYRDLMAAGHSPELHSMQTLGYRHMGMHVNDGVPLEEVVALLKRDTRRFAKQQLSWLRSEADVLWAPADLDIVELARDAERHLAAEPLVAVWASPEIAHW